MAIILFGWNSTYSTNRNDNRAQLIFGSLTLDGKRYRKCLALKFVNVADLGIDSHRLLPTNFYRQRRSQST